MEAMVIIHNFYRYSDYPAFNKGILVFQTELEGFCLKQGANV